MRFPPQNPTTPAGAGRPQGSRAAFPPQGIPSAVSTTGKMFTNAVFPPAEYGRYELPAPFDISELDGAAPDQTIDTSTKSFEPAGITFNPDGTRFFLCATDNATQYVWELSTGFDLSTASFLEQAAVSVDAFDMGFNDDGTSVIYGLLDELSQYNLDTPYDLSSMTFHDQFTLSNAEHWGITFGNGGSNIFVSGLLDGASQVTQINLGTPYDLGTITGGNDVDISSTIGDRPGGLTFNPDGTRAFMADLDPGDIYEYELGTAWDISTLSFVQSVSLSVDAIPALAFQNETIG